MSDITTVEEVEAGDYTVRVAQTDDGRAWEAVVLSEGASTSKWSGPGMLSLMRAASEKKQDDVEEPVGTPVTAPHRWVAVGFAIEAYEWSEVGEEPMDVQDGYRKVSGAGFEIDDDLKERIQLHSTTFSGSFDPGGFEVGEDDE